MSSYALVKNIVKAFLSEEGDLAESPIVDSQSVEIIGTFKRVDGQASIKLQTTASGITSIEDYLDFLEYLQANDIAIESEEERWLSPEVVEGMLKLKKAIAGNRISDGLRKTSRPVGRPLDTSRVELVRKLHMTGDYTLEDIARKVGVSRATVHRYLKRK